MSSIIWKTTTYQVPNLEVPKLPIAVAILAPTQLTSEKQAQLNRAMASVPFAQTIWLGQAEDPIEDFAAARNSALNQISEPWVLWLDSDEWFPDPVTTAQTLAATLHHAETKPQSLAFALKRQDILHKLPLNFGEAPSVTLARLHRKQAGQFIRPVHEVFQPTTRQPIQTLPLQLHHEAHQSLSSFFAKIVHYSGIRAQELLSQPQPPSRQKLLVELLILPPSKFFYNFCWLKGWRDGWRGLSYAFIMSLHSAMVRITALEQLHEKS